MASFLLRFRFSTLALFLWVSLFTGFSLVSQPCQAQEKAGLELLLLHTNDLHSYLAGRDAHGNACLKSEGCTGGFARTIGGCPPTAKQIGDFLEPLCK